MNNIENGKILYEIISERIKLSNKEINHLEYIEINHLEYNVKVQGVYIGSDKYANIKYRINNYNDTNISVEFIFIINNIGKIFISKYGSSSNDIHDNSFLDNKELQSNIINEMINTLIVELI